MSMKRTCMLYLALSMATIASCAATFGVEGRIRGGTSRRKDDPTVIDVLLSTPSRDEMSSLRRPGRQDRATSPAAGDSVDRFAEECEAFLLSPEAAEDGVISQIDFADMLLNNCRIDDLCPKDYELMFEQLDVDLQLDFIEGVCPPRGSFECILDLYKMWLDGGVFGFPADTADVDILVRSLCVSIYPDAVESGFASAAPTASPSTSRTRRPSISAHPSTFPSAAPTDVPSHHPYASSWPSIAPFISTAPSSSVAPSATSTTQSREPSHHPSASSWPSISTLPPAIPTGDGSISSGAVIGISSTLALLFAVACIVYTDRRPGPGSLPVKDSFREPNHFGTAAHEPWGKYVSSLPMSYMGLNCSSDSSSSSFRDYRFVAVFGPEGKPIPQFNPNTAGAVVIGSVTIGAANSSFGSGPFAATGSSSMTRSFFSLGTISPKSEGGISSKDDMSSLSSRRSTKRVKPGYRRMNRRQRKSIWLDKRSRGPNGSPQSSRSKTSQTTVPMSYRKLQTIERRMDCDRQISFGDWMAVSNMTEFRHPGLITDAAAILTQRKVFFNVLCPETSVSSECRSLPNMHYIARVGSSEAGASSLSESFFQTQQLASSRQQSVTTSTESVSTTRFVPWRKEGFSPSLQLSDSRQSNESASSSDESNVSEAKKRIGLFRPAKAVFAKYKKKTNVKDWFSFKKRQYHHLRREHCVEEDSEVLSMNSYSSHVNLLPVEAAARADLPNLVLGTFAAATMPIGKQKVVSSKPHLERVGEGHDRGRSTGHDDGGASAAGEPAAEVGQRALEPAQHGHDPDVHEGDGVLCQQASAETTISTRITLHISSFDVNVRSEETDSESFSAYSRSDFESSAPTSSAPSSSVSSSTDTSQSNSQRTTATSPLVSLVDPQNEITTVNATVDDSLKDASHKNSQDGSSFPRLASQDLHNETFIVSRSGSDSDDALVSSDEDNSGFLAVDPDPSPLIDAVKREAESVPLYKGGFHPNENCVLIVDDGSVDMAVDDAKVDGPNVLWESQGIGP